VPGCIFSCILLLWFPTFFGLHSGQINIDKEE
jgi:hypothetical protein